MRDLRLRSLTKNLMLASNGVHFNSYFILKRNYNPNLYRKAWILS